MEPLESDDGAGSDHKVAYCRVKLARTVAFTWQSFSYRHYNDHSVDLFKRWVTMHDWSEVHNAEGSNDMTDKYQATIDWALDKFFPKKTTRRKSTDLPWMNRRLKNCLLYTSPSPRDRQKSRMPSSA